MTFGKSIAGLAALVSALTISSPGKAQAQHAQDFPPIPVWGIAERTPRVQGAHAGIRGDTIYLGTISSSDGKFVVPTNNRYRQFIVADPNEAYDVTFIGAPGTPITFEHTRGQPLSATLYNTTDILQGRDDAIAVLQGQITAGSAYCASDCTRALQLVVPNPSRVVISEQVIKDHPLPPPIPGAPPKLAPPVVETPPVVIPPYVPPREGFLSFAPAIVRKATGHAAVRGTDFTSCYAAEGWGVGADVAYRDSRTVVHAIGVLAPGAAGCDKAEDADSADFKVNMADLYVLGLRGKSLAIGGALDLFYVAPDTEEHDKYRVLTAGPMIGTNPGSFVAGAGPVFVSAASRHDNWAGIGAQGFVGYVTEPVRVNARASLYKAGERTGFGAALEGSATPLKIGPVAIGPFGGIRYNEDCLEDHSGRHNTQAYLGAAIRF